MKPQSLDLLIAFKVIGLSSLLSGTEKSIATAVLDHYNRKTGQCDPSIDTLAALVGVSRRSVQRAVNYLARYQLFHRYTHRGHFHRNQYAPNWAQFRKLETEWKHIRSVRNAQFAGKNLSPSRRQTCRLAGDKDVTQTCPSNQFKETFVAHSSSSSTSYALTGRKWPGKEAQCQTGKSRAPFQAQQSRSFQAAHDAAERRWNLDLQNRYRDKPSVYARMIEALDAELQNNVTKAELGRRGSGVPFLLDELRRRGIA